MPEEDFSKFGFRTVWHLTDIDNLPSIAQNGLMSRALLEQKSFHFEKVGADFIVEKRTEFKNYALTFVTPHNKFIRGRFENHTTYHPNSKGVALLEIDLQTAYETRSAACYVTQGNLAAQRVEIVKGLLPEFVQILNWHAILDRSMSESRENDIYGQAEVLFPHYIKPQAIRRFWVGKDTNKDYLKSIGVETPVFLANEFFESRGIQSLPPPAEHNFSNIKPLPPTRIKHRQFGQGVLVCNLGGNCIAKFVNYGLQLIRFGDYDWLD